MPATLFSKMSIATLTSIVTVCVGIFAFVVSVDPSFLNAFGTLITYKTLHLKKVAEAKSQNIHHGFCPGKVNIRIALQPLSHILTTQACVALQ